jgi:hypothetical protein
MPTSDPAAESAAATPAHECPDRRNVCGELDPADDDGLGGAVKTSAKRQTPEKPKSDGPMDIGDGL